MFVLNHLIIYVPVKESPVNNYFKGFVYYKIAATILIIILTLLIGIICSCFVKSKKKVLFTTFI